MRAVNNTHKIKMLDNIDLINIFNCIKTNVSAYVQPSSATQTIKSFFITIIYIEYWIILSCIFFIIYSLRRWRWLEHKTKRLFVCNLLIILYTIYCACSDSFLFKYYFLKFCLSKVLLVLLKLVFKSFVLMTHVYIPKKSYVSLQ